MSLQSAADVPLLISSPNSSSERRISPSWSIAHLKNRLEPITGVPASSQQLSLRVGSQDAVPITAQDEEQTRLGHFPLQPYAEIIVSIIISVLPPRQHRLRSLRTSQPRTALSSLATIFRQSWSSCEASPCVLTNDCLCSSFAASVAL